MVLAFMASSIVLMALWPDALPPQPVPVESGPGVTHVEAAAQNQESLTTFKQLKMRRRVRMGGAFLTVAVIMRLAYGVGRRLE